MLGSLALLALSTRPTGTYARGRFPQAKGGGHVAQVQALDVEHMLQEGGVGGIGANE